MFRHAAFPGMILIFCLGLFPALSQAGSSVKVVDASGQAVLDAVVYAESVGASGRSKSASAEISQKDKKFIPLVTVVQTGTSISFPNNDTVRHHAYSFSPARPFELKLYSGKPASPILFDKAGTVVIGCNIHDHMIAYVQVVDTPYFAITDQKGMAYLANIPAGKYILKAWHYKQAGDISIVGQPLQVGAEDSATVIRLAYPVN